MSANEQVTKERRAGDQGQPRVADNDSSSSDEYVYSSYGVSSTPAAGTQKKETQEKEKPEKVKQGE